jgi:hypothetical protein
MKKLATIALLLVLTGVAVNAVPHQSTSSTPVLYACGPTPPPICFPGENCPK